jgi:hypothetical protein
MSRGLIYESQARHLIGENVPRLHQAAKGTGRIQTLTTSKAAFWIAFR